MLEGNGSSSGRSVRASELERKPVRRVPTGESELDALLGGGWAVGSSALLWGVGGAGKSRLALRWSTRLGVTLYACPEMPAELVVETAASAGAELERLYLSDSLDGLEAECVRLRARALVVDSISVAPRPEELTKRLALWAPKAGVTVFLLSHVNRRGRARGSTGIEHWPDYNVKVSPRGRTGCRVRVGKSRYCPRGSCALELGQQPEPSSTNQSAVSGSSVQGQGNHAASDSRTASRAGSSPSA